MASKGTPQIRIGRLKKKVEEFAYWKRVYEEQGQKQRAETVGAIIDALVDEFGDFVNPVQGL